VCFANDIDKLQTNEDVSNFLIKKISKKFKDYPLLNSNPQETDIQPGRNKFFKTDIDNNRLTDLIIYGNHLVIILDKGGNDYEVRYLDGGAFQQNNANLISIDSAGMPKKIIIQQFGRPKEQYDTLVYLFNSFIEYNPHPDQTLNFEKIIFRTSPCLGECPVFEITISKDREAMYKAVRFNEQAGGFSGFIPKTEFDDLVLFLQYLQPDKLKSSYSVGRTDAQSARTEILYNGKSKIVSDYGEIGSYGLNTLYLRFFRWRTSVDWTQVSGPVM
ncbi:MAG: DUF6438 domain-containing protein, partial [Bacteroidota bacterium]